MYPISDQPVSSLLVIALGALAALAALIAALRTRGHPGPVIAYQNIPEVSKLSESDRKISVTYEDRHVDRVTKMRIWFWNARRKPIRSEEIPAAAPFTITLLDPGNDNPDILDFRTVKTTGPDVNFSFARTASPSTLKLNFNSLNYKCGALFEVQHDGGANCRPEFHGAIPGSDRKPEVLPVPFEATRRARPLPPGGALRKFFGRSGGLVLLLVFSFEMSFLLAAHLDNMNSPHNPALEAAVAKFLIGSGVESKAALRSAHYAVESALDEGTSIELYLLSMSPVFLAVGLYTCLARRKSLPRPLRPETKQSARAFVSRKKNPAVP